MKHFTFCILLIEDSMGMHGIVSACEILYFDHDNVINLGPQYRAQEAQPGRSVRSLSERIVCKLSEHGLLINTADEVGTF